MQKYLLLILYLLIVWALYLHPVELPPVQTGESDPEVEPPPHQMANSRFYE